MKLSQHFSYQEFIKSQTAARKGIKNEPDDAQLYSMKMVCMNILEPIRTTFERPVIITSGFRSPELCVAIGSSTNSQHAKGEAADFEIPGVDNRELALWIKSELEYDQLILEFYKDNEPTSGWIHCSYTEGMPRKQFLHAFREEGKTKYKPILGKAKDLLV